MSFQEYAAVASIVLSVGVYASYISSVVKNRVKPHFFSWFIWGLLMLIGATAQWAGGAGAGAWAVGFGGFNCLTIAGLAVFYGEKTITRSDWAAFLAAMAIIPIWSLTDDALVATALVTTIDLLGCYPTFRKSYHQPFQENILSFSLITLACLLRLLAVERINLTTALYPASLVVLNGALVAMLVWRRSVLEGSVKEASR